MHLVVYVVDSSHDPQSLQTAPLSAVVFSVGAFCLEPLKNPNNKEGRRCLAEVFVLLFCRLSLDQGE